MKRLRNLFKVTQLVGQYDYWYIGLQFSNPLVSKLKQRQSQKLSKNENKEEEFEMRERERERGSDIGSINNSVQEFLF
jgi:hypothetical protein